MALMKIIRLRKRGVALRKIATKTTREGTKSLYETVANVRRAQARGARGINPGVVLRLY
jgi:hypothetical protein